MELDKIHPELRDTYRRIPALPIHNRLLLALSRPLMTLVKAPDKLLGVSISDRELGPASIRLYQPPAGPRGAGLLWIHGGGYILGAPKINDRECARFARDLGLTVVAAGYRLAPRHRFPAAADDCFQVWRWFVDNAAELGVDSGRIAIAGQSAGGGLAAGLVQRIVDDGGAQPAGQALFCPMLDDRTAANRKLDRVKHRLWNNRNNRGAWRHYLGTEPGGSDLPPYAAPARRDNLAGLPPTWIGVGDVDLFFDEDREYAERLRRAGVICQFVDYPGAPHAFELLAPDTPIARQCWESNYHFLREVLAL